MVRVFVGGCGLRQTTASQCESSGLKTVPFRPVVREAMPEQQLSEVVPIVNLEQVLRL